MDTAQQTEIINRLQQIISTNSSTGADDALIERIMRRLGFANCRIVAGCCYLEGRGQPCPVQVPAKQLLDMFQQAIAYEEAYGHDCEVPDVHP